MNCACLFHTKERVAAASGYSLLARAVTSAVSVVKVDRVQGGVCTKIDTVQSVSVATRVATNGPFW